MSSATVRNILAELEAAGLLTHPHTSAGRIPTDAGYRFYVESIVDAVPLPAVEQLMIRHQFGQVEFASEHWFRLAATTLASVTRAAGLATPAKPRAAHIRRVDLVAINERMASLILVLREGSIKQALVTLDDADAIDQATLNAVAALLNERLVDLTAADAGARRSRRSTATRRSTSSPGGSASGSSRILRDYDAAAIEEVFSDGLLNVMEAPEFAQSDKLRRVFSALENRAYLGELVGSVAGVRADPGLHRRTRTSRSRCRTSRWSSRRTAGRAGRSASSASSGRPGCPIPGDRHGPLRVRSHERTGGSPVCLNERPRRRAQERADAHRHLADRRCSPRSRALRRRARRGAQGRPRNTSPRSSASGPSS